MRTSVQEEATFGLMEDQRYGMHRSILNRHVMKGLPEEEEEEEGEVWSSRTDPPPKIPRIITRQGDEEPSHGLGDLEDNEDLCWDGDGFLEDIPEPPDGGYGWMIVAASFLCNMVVDGISYSFGIFLVHIVNFYQTPKGETAWIGSLLTGCYLGTGPIVSALTNKFGCRPVTIAGSLISTAAFLLSTVAPNVKVLMFTYGIMGGVGFGLIYLPAIVSVGYYFSTKRAFATGLAVCGSGMGAFVFAPITRYLLDRFDWKGALIILSGLALNCTVFGALMRPLTPKRKKRTQNTEDGQDGTFVSKDKADSGLVLLSTDLIAKNSSLNTEPGVQSTLNINEACSRNLALPKLGPHPHGELHNSVDLFPTMGLRVTTESSAQQLSTVTHVSQSLVRKCIPMESTGQNSSLGTLKPSPSPNPTPNIPIKTCRSQMNVKEFQRRFTMPAVMPASANILYPAAQNNYVVQRSSVGRDISWSVQGGVVRKIKMDRRDLARPLYRKDIFYSGSIANLPEFQQSRNSVRSYLASVTTIPCSEALGTQMDVDESDTSSSKCFKLPRSIIDTLQEALDLSLLTQAPFLLACIANIVGMMGFYIPFVYLTDSSVMKGIDQERAAFLISVLGIANLIGRLVFGYIVDKPRVRALDVNNLCLCVSGIAAFTIPFCFSYSAIVAASTIFSFFVSAYISLTSIILVDMVGLDKLTNSFGLLSLFRGAASIVGPPIAGNVFDVTGSYDIPFYLAGGLLILSAILTFFVPFVTRRPQKKLTENVSESVTPPQTKDYSTSSDTDSGRPESIAIGEAAL